MAVSALAIGVHRLMAAEKTAAAVREGEQVHIYPVMLPAKVATGITVNRTSQYENEDGETVNALAITVFAKTVNEFETIAETLIEEINETSNFEFGGLIGIEFVKGMSDVTGYDASRGLFFRQVEFLQKA